MLGSALSRILGIVREQVIAGLFGAGAAVDAFTVATRIPTTVFDLLIGGVISAALVPVFSDYSRDEDAPELRRVASTVLNVAALLLSAAVLLIVLCAPWLAAFYGASFSADTQAIATTMLRITAPAVLMMGLSGGLMAILYSRQRFTPPALAQSLFNLGIISAGLVLHVWLGVYSIVIGVLVGTFLQVCVQAFALRRIGWRPWLDLKHPAIRRIGRLYLPVALGLVVSATAGAIDSNLASRTGQGNIAAMRFGTTLMQFPIGLVGVAVSSAVLPKLAQSFSQEYRDGARARSLPKEFQSTLATGLVLVLLAIVPATVALVVLRESVVELLFQRGAFSLDDTRRTALAFLAYAPGIPANAIDQLLIFAFYARKDTRTPVLVGVAAVGAYLVAAFSLVGPLGMPGLALAISVQWTAHAAIMTVLIVRRTGARVWLPVLNTGARVLVAALAMAGAIALAMALSQGLAPNPSQAGLALHVLVAALVGSLVYTLSLTALGVREARQALAFAASRVRSAF